MSPLGDAMSLIATVLLSFVSTLAGFANRWSMKLQSRGSAIPTPKGNVVVRYPNGSFLVVECDESIARELFFTPETIKYLQTTTTYQIVSLMGTSMLMCGVICLANAHEVLQIMWAASFIILNAAYWIVATLPDERNWDLSFYNVKEHICDMGHSSPSFAHALWKAIAFAHSTEWTHMGTPARPCLSI